MQGHVILRSLRSIERAMVLVPRRNPQNRDNRTSIPRSKFFFSPVQVHPNRLHGKASYLQGSLPSSWLNAKVPQAHPHLSARLSDKQPHALPHPMNRVLYQNLHEPHRMPRPTPKRSWAA